MSVRTLSGTYDYPSRSRQELYGDDLLVSIYWEGNLMFCAPAMFRVPASMNWADFMAGVVNTWAAIDPDHDPAASRSWTLDGEKLAPRADASLADLGVGHKSLLVMRIEDFS